MRKNLGIALPALFAVSLLLSCGQEDALSDADAHRAEVLEWRAGRLQSLLAPTGYLTLAGLFWLDPGRYSFGSDAANDVVFPASAAAVIGDFRVSEAGIAMDVVAGVEVHSDGLAVDTLFISDDTTTTPVAVTHGTLAWTAVQRGGRFAIRLRDFEHPAVAAFGELPYYDINPTLRVNATLKQYSEPRTVQVGTVIEGLGWSPQSPGVVVFEVGGASYELEAYESDDSLFYVFADATSRDDTYGAGRFLYSELPDEGGVLVLDFNKAYSPPCAFNDFATCPIASPRNRLPLRIEAGEKYDPALHYSAAH